MIKWNNFIFQNGIRRVRINIDLFHDYVLFFLIIITILVMISILSLIFNFFINKKTIELQSLEFIWTVIPGVVLLFLGVPSLKLLYETENFRNTDLSVKIIGHQWYWSYELRDFNSVEFDSYIVPEIDLEKGIFRLLEVDNRLIIPINVSVRFLVTARDVLHSWAIPSLRLKIDATPGRLNQIFTIFLNRGLFYGQCSEICGRNHRFMPIVVEVTSLNLFKNWINRFNN
jgi:cytochrome c oxidase subunit 2